LSAADLIPIGLFAAALWLAYETRNLRKKTGEQLDFQRESEWRLQTITPYLTLTVQGEARNFESITVQNESSNLGTNAVERTSGCDRTYRLLANQLKSS
jgi:hypothetical protein